MKVSSRRRKKDVRLALAVLAPILGTPEVTVLRKKSCVPYRQYLVRKILVCLFDMAQAKGLQAEAHSPGVRTPFLLANLKDKRIG